MVFQPRLRLDCVEPGGEELLPCQACRIHIHLWGRCQQQRQQQDQQKQQLQVKSCFHVRHDAFTYTFWVRLNCHGSKQWYQREGHKILKRLTTAQRDTVAGEMFARLVDSKTTRTPELRAWHSPDSKQSTCSRLVGLGEGGDDVCSTLMMRH